MRQDILARNYAAAMEEIKFRIEVIRSALVNIAKNSDAERYATNLISAELCYFQFRRISEVLALAVLEAHREKSDESFKKLEKDYQADKLITNIINAHPRGFPVPIAFIEGEPRASMLHISESGERFNPRIFKEIYHTCGDRLHVGTLAMLKKGKRKELDVAQLREWYDAYVFGLATHLLPLEGQEVLYVVMHAVEDGKVHCQFGKAAN